VDAGPDLWPPCALLPHVPLVAHDVHPYKRKSHKYVFHSHIPQCKSDG
jgi:hypothetical protein